MNLKISARQSELAQLQAYRVGEALQRDYPQINIDYRFRESLGDKNLTDPLWKMPDKGVFTEDFYADLIDGNTDMVVHSWKDLPTEEKKDTLIAATLKRADQRDLLLFKKKSLHKKNIKIFSSSPRRAYNLQSFFSWALPWRPDHISFENVRGNIPTRIRKWQSDESIDGLVLAKAAVDRLIDCERFTDTQMLLRQTLEQQHWMVLPLSLNPNAAAQGALAIEVNKKRDDLIELLEKINCKVSYESARKEREILKSFGGGCHLALGMSRLVRPYGTIEIVRGLTPAGENIQQKIFKPLKKIPEGLNIQTLNFASQRKARADASLSSYNAVFVSKAEAWNFSTDYAGLVWSAGLETWKKLAHLGLWVSGSSESLGEAEDMQIENYYREPLNWGRLSHSGASAEGHKTLVAGYDLELSLLSPKIELNGAFIWKSALEFDLAVQKFPLIKNQLHICGPGKTYDALLKRLGGAEKLYVTLFE